MSIESGTRVEWNGDLGTVVAVLTEPSATVDLDSGRRVTVGLSSLRETLAGARRGVRRPPAWLEAEMAAAHGDDVKLGLLHARYEQWLAEHGESVPQRGRPPRADEAAR